MCILNISYMDYTYRSIYDFQINHSEWIVYNIVLFVHITNIPAP